MSKKIVKYIPKEEMDASLSSVSMIENEEVGSTCLPFDKLTPDDFERLLYALYRDNVNTNRFYDNVSLMVSGSDEGRDVWLTKNEIPVGLIQCKRVKNGFSAPETVREIIKFLLFAQLDKDLLPHPKKFTYCLAISADPAKTTVTFFSAPKKWFKINDSKIKGYIETVIKNYSSFDGLKISMVLPIIKKQLLDLEYDDLRPVDLNGLLHDSDSIRSRFFSTKVEQKLDEIKEIFKDSIEKKPSIQLDFSDRSAILEDADRCSYDIAVYPQCIEGKHIDRPELLTLMQHITGTHSGSTLLIGDAGSGKSVLLAELHQMLRRENTPVFAIKADTFSVDIKNIKDIEEDLQMVGSIEDDIKALAKSEKVVLIIDQLDSVSDVMDQKSKRMNIILDLVKNLKSFKDSSGSPLSIHILASSRPFEAKFDNRFIPLRENEITLELPPFQKVSDLLHQLNIEPTLVPSSLQETLRTPFALGIYVALVSTGTPSRDLKPGNLLDKWLDSKLPRGQEGEPFHAFLRTLAEDMTESETLCRPMEYYEPEQPEIVRETLGAGIVVRDEKSNIWFKHQSWLDYFQAKSLHRPSDLMEYVKNRQNTLFSRGTILRSLESLRKLEPTAYEQSLDLLLENGNGVRRHIKHLVVGVLNASIIPLPCETHWIGSLIRDDHVLANRAIVGIASNWSKWRIGLNDQLSYLMQVESHTNSAKTLLIEEAAEHIDKVTYLIDKFWTEKKHDGDVFYIYERALSTDSYAISRVDLILSRTKIEHSAISSYAVRLSEQGDSNIAISLIRKWLDNLEDNKSISVTLNGLNDIAQRAPFKFVTELFPWFVSLSKRNLEHNAPLINTYRKTTFQTSLMHSVNPSQLLDVFRNTLSTCAQDCYKDLHALLETYWSVEIEEIQCLIAEAYISNVTESCGESLSYLLGDTRRLNLGYDFRSVDNNHTSRKLISEILSIIDDTDLAELRNYILEWELYPLLGELPHTNKVRHDWKQWSEEARLSILSEFTEKHLPASLVDKVSQWNREKEREKDRNIQRSKASFFKSPMTYETMASSVDEVIISMLNEVHDNTGRNHEARTGGVIELSQEFCKLAKADPVRVVRLLREHLKPGKHEIVSGKALVELASNEKYDQIDVKELIWELSEKGFSSADWRREAATSFKVLARHLGGLNGKDIALLDSWLIRDDDILKSQLKNEQPRILSFSTRENKAESKMSAFLLGNPPGIEMRPEGNGEFYAAIYCGYLYTSSPDFDNWIDTMISKVEEPDNASVWSFVLLMCFHGLARCSKVKVSDLAHKILNRFPETFEDKRIVWPIYNLRDKVDDSVLESIVTFWLENENFELRQIAGEYVAASIIQGDDSANMNALLYRIMTVEDIYPQCGVLFSASALWRSDTLSESRNSHELLMAATQTDDEEIAYSLSSAFANIHTVCADESISELLRAFNSNLVILGKSLSSNFIEVLTQLLNTKHRHINKLILDIMENIMKLVHQHPSEYSKYIYDGELVSLTVTLQSSLSDNVRDRAMTLYEQLLDAGVYRAKEVAETALRT